MADVTQRGDPTRDPSFRCVLISGPAGSGKTTVCRLGHAAMTAAWGGPAAAIDVDQLYANVDPRWELSYDDARNALMLEQAAYLAGSLFRNGWSTVMICGNSLFDPADTGPLIRRLDAIAVVHHISLVTAPAQLVARTADQPDREPQQVIAEAELLARKVHPGTAMIDNSDLTPVETLAEIVRLVDAGQGVQPPPL